MSEMLGTDARALIDQATGGDEPSSADRDRVRARLALALVATTGTFAVGTAKIAAGSLAPATTAAAAPAAGVAGTVGAVGTAGAGAGAGAVTAASVGVGMKVVLGVVALVAVAGAGGVAVSQRRASLSPPAVARAANANAVAAAGVPVSPVAPVALAAPAPVPASAPALELDDPPSSAVVPATSAPHASAASATPDVAEELVLLREARSALKAGDPARSLQLLAEHAHRFPHGALTEEREAARAVASCARADSGGSADEARAAVARFFRAYPRSLHASRVHAACDAIDAH